MRRLAVLIVAIAIVAGIVERGRDLLQEYEGGHRGECAALFSILAKNHLRYGILETGGVPVLNPVKVGTDHFAYYMHHPPGAVLVAWVGAALSSASAAGLRFVFLGFALGIVVVVGRLARGGTSPARATTLCVAALMPALVYYGPFPNFELPTLFFALVALHLFLRYLRRGRAKDAWRAALMQALAVGCDWIALGLPIMLMLLLPLRRDGPRTFADGRRVRKGFALGLLFGGSALAVIAVRLQYAIQLARYGHSADGDAGKGLVYILQATPLAKDFSFATFCDRVAGYAHELFGWPLLAVAGLGVLVSLLRLVKGRLGDGELAAWAVLGIGIANETVLANHATGHDYYLLYAAPALALFCGEFVRAISKGSFVGARGALGLCVCVALAAQLWFQSHGVVQSRRNVALAQLGRAIAEQTATRESDPIFFAGDYTLQVVAQSDRYVDGVRNLGELAFKRDRALLTFGMGGRKTLFLAGREQIASVDPTLITWLDSVSPRQVLGPFVAWELGVLESIAPPK